VAAHNSGAAIILPQSWNVGLGCPSMGVDGSRRRSRRMNKDSQRGRGWSYWSRTVAYEVKATKGNACHRFGFANWWFEFDLHGWARDVFSSCWYLTSYGIPVFLCDAGWVKNCEN